MNGGAASPRSAATDAELALLLEVAATPTPGNVDRRRDIDGLRFEHLLAGAAGARPGLAAAAAGEPVGAAFEQAVEGMRHQSGGNTQFGALLLLVPLVGVAREGAPTRDSAAAAVEATTVDDAVAFYRAFEHVDVGVGDRPVDVEAPDVGRGADAETALRAGDWTLYEVMADSKDVDGIAHEWTAGFDRTFAVSDRLRKGTKPLLDRAADAFLDQLATHPDTHVAKRHGETTARRVRDWAAAIRDSDGDADLLAESLVDAGVNPGTTADVVAGGLFVALRRGVDV